MIRRVVIMASMCAGVLLLAACSAGERKLAASAEPVMETAPAAVQESRTMATQVEMANVDLHLDPALILHVHYLSGQFLAARKGEPPAFDDKLSYIVSIDSAEVGVSAASMTHALNTYVFKGPDAPLKNLTLSIQGDQIRQSGTLNKRVGIPFEMTGTMSATADGRIRIHATQVKAVHLPVKGVMKFLGLEMAEVVNTRKTKGVSVEGNDILLDAAQMLPPPTMRGRITAVRIEGDEIIQTFGTARKAQGGKFAGNYMWYRGGVLRFGKLTMKDTDMRLIDADPTDPFDFFPDHYQSQLQAGYSKTTASGGLLVYMPDYGKLSKAVSAHVPSASGADRMAPTPGSR